MFKTHWFYDHFMCEETETQRDKWCAHFYIFLIEQDSHSVGPPLHTGLMNMPDREGMIRHDYFHDMLRSLLGETSRLGKEPDVTGWLRSHSSVPRGVKPLSSHPTSDKATSTKVCKHWNCLQSVTHRKRKPFQTHHLESLALSLLAFVWQTCQNGRWAVAFRGPHDTLWEPSELEAVSPDTPKDR